MSRVIAVSNQKGGVGKTVSCVNLGIGLAQEGKKVLMIDADPQGSLTISLGYEEPDEMEYSLATLMMNIVNDEKLNIEKTILHHKEGVDLIPANIELSAIEVSLVNAMSRELILRSMVDRLREFYDYIIIDCIGLIEKKRQGQGKPTMIYLKQFMVQDVQKCRNFTSEQKAAVSEVKNLHILKCKNAMSRSEEITLPEVKNIHTNKNNINNTELSNTESYLIVSGNDEIGSDVQAYAELIRDNIDLDILLERYPFDKELLNGIFDLILETVLCRNNEIVVASNKYPAELVRSKFLKLTSSHIEYAMGCMKSNTTKVHNIKKYLLATLFNAPSTISGYYQAEVNHDYPQFAVSGK